jgi:hypothetical protein
MFPADEGLAVDVPQTGADALAGKDLAGQLDLLAVPQVAGLLAQDADGGEPGDRNEEASRP